MSRRRKWLFRLLAVCLSLTPVLVAELICRIAGYGGYPPVFKALNAYGNTQFVGTFQPGINTFFWQNLSATGSMEEQVFVMPKPEGLRRIMTFGGSAMRGFPQPKPLISTSFLNAMLGDAWPDQELEVLNFGTTAIASFPVMYILEEALEYEPDLVIIYSGNNEFYGTHGVASLHAFGQSTLSMKLTRAVRQTGLGQWLLDLGSTSDANEAADSDGRAKSLMESVIASGDIGPDDRRRTAAADNLENHLIAMVKACNSRSVSVILCTLPANERDLAPLGKDSVSALNGQDAETFRQLLIDGEKLLIDQPDEARKAFESAVALDGRHARGRFLLGRSFSALGRHADAGGEYQLAKEYDPMPWRAPPSLSEVVRQVAREHAAILCDLEQSFQTNSPTGATGWELMDDHVHPSLRGQALIAESIIESMTELSGPMRVDRVAVASIRPWDEYARALGENEFDRFGVQYRMRTLFRAPFYSESNPEALDRVERLCAEYEGAFSPTEQKAIEYWKKPEVHGSGFRPITGFVGAALLADGDYANADRVLSIARRSVAEYSLWNLELTWKALGARRHLRDAPTDGDIAMAREMLEDAETILHATGKQSPELSRHLGLIHHLLGENELAIPHLKSALGAVSDMSGFEVVQALVIALDKTGRRDAAIKILRSPVKDQSLSKACGVLLAKILSSKE